MVRGFILQPTYRIEAGKPIVYIFGKLETGEPFLVRDGRSTPHFFVRESDAPRAWQIGADRQAPTGWTTLDLEPVLRVEVPTPPDAAPLRDRLRAAGIPCYEADVRFALRFLIDRHLRGSIAIEGASRAGNRIPRIYDDPRLTPCEFRPKLKILSLDLETDTRGTRVLSAALHGPGFEEVLLSSPADRERPAGSVFCGTEKNLLLRLAETLRHQDPDVITGWSVVEFDLSILERRARAHDLSLDLGRIPGPMRIHRDRSAWGTSRAEIPGRMVLDGIQLLKGAFVKLEDYRLETAARALLGEGKTLAGPDRHREIERLFKEDLPAFVRYNLTDARLVSAILERTRLVDLAVERSLLTGMPLDRVSASIASFDFLYLSEIRRRSRVGPTVQADSRLEPVLGGAVLEPVTGLHERILGFDFKSLYPSLILTFNIDPVEYLPRPAPEEDVIRAPNGACFSRRPGILPEILSRLFPRREAARQAGDAIASQAIKILMNSFYGVLATPACRFHSHPVANAITHFGQSILLWTKRHVEEMGHRVLYGDTDSLFVESNAATPEYAIQVGKDLAARINRDLSKHLLATYRVNSRLELEFERLYHKLFLPSMRHGIAGARKRYAGWVDENGRRQILFVGMESVRSDWTELSKAFQLGLYERVFSEEPVEAYVRETVEKLRSGASDGMLVYRKSLRKPIDQYTETTPPHVKAARLLPKITGRVIHYVMTVDGPQPEGYRESPIDYEHYVEKQLEPVADALLSHLGTSFRAILGGERQMDLF
ncbi:MAG TPA: DNA polymerase II [Candidatus Polarisedimenticolia bacterium]|jgi:DNA polymerase-2|nr:DNA polymerase II [Candidatus Polarisedimenticolia bacterium]